MNLFLTLRIAAKALRKNKLRAGLTVLGVVIGIAAVTTMVSIGQSAGQLVQDQIQGLGTNVFVVFPNAGSQGGARQGLVVTLTAEDVVAMENECPSVMAASPIVGAQGQIIYGNANWSPNQLEGVGVNYLTVRNWPLARGGFFTENDITSAAKVCVIGHTLVAKLFQTTNPIGETIRIKNIPFTVIGILESKGANMVGEDQDNIVLCPYSTVRLRLQGSSFDNIDAVMASARSPALIDAAAQETYSLLLERHRIPPGEPADFEVGTSAEIASILGIITGVMTMLLASIAGISLLVGGVGIMNIMLVSVTERTREIGIRLAVGARSRDILRQFLIEAMLLSSVGGVVGILLGISASVGIMTIINSVTAGSKWPIVVSIPAAVVALAFSAAVGMFFGYYPARRASKLDPIDALRYE
jgi:putative ABC transport system permease protein